MSHLSGKRYRHIASGGIYVVVGHAQMQCSTIRSIDMREATLYRRLADVESGTWGQLIVRMSDEFHIVFEGPVEAT